MHDRSIAFYVTLALAVFSFGYVTGIAKPHTYLAEAALKDKYANACEANRLLTASINTLKVEIHSLKTENQQLKTQIEALKDPDSQSP